VLVIDLRMEQQQKTEQRYLKQRQQQYNDHKRRHAVT
jgi:hypothetical protein